MNKQQVTVCLFASITIILMNLFYQEYNINCEKLHMWSLN